MFFGILVFPGTTCEVDTYKWIHNGGYYPVYISSSQRVLPSVDFLILPGGFAFGDRVYETATGLYTKDPGIQALQTPVMEAVHDAVNRVPILGICNGFQILTHAGILPGLLSRNILEKFICNHTDCFFIERSPLHFLENQPTLVNIPIAHGYGRYRVTEEELHALRDNNQIFLEYDINKNGSDDHIAGICNTSRTVWGMMPHPERSPFAQLLLENMVAYARQF